MIKLVNGSVIDTVKLLVDKLQRNNANKPWLDEINFHLANKTSNGSYSKYSISRLKSIIRYLGPKYLLE